MLSGNLNASNRTENSNTTILIMSLLFWKKNRAVDTFAANLASEFYSSIQPEAVLSYLEGRDRGKKKANKQHRNVEGKIHHMLRQIDQFKTLHSLGVYSIARLHLKFRDRLEELGYDADVAKKVDELMVLHSH